MSEKIKTSPSTGWKTPQLNLTLCWPKTGKPFQAETFAKFPKIP